MGGDLAGEVVREFVVEVVVVEGVDVDSDFVDCEVEAQGDGYEEVAGEGEVCGG